MTLVAKGFLAFVPKGFWLQHWKPGVVMSEKAINLSPQTEWRRLTLKLLKTIWRLMTCLLNILARHHGQQKHLWSYTHLKWTIVFLVRSGWHPLLYGDILGHKQRYWQSHSSSNKYKSSNKNWFILRHPMNIEYMPFCCAWMWSFPQSKTKTNWQDNVQETYGCTAFAYFMGTFYPDCRTAGHHFFPFSIAWLHLKVMKVARGSQKIIKLVLLLSCRQGTFPK